MKHLKLDVKDLEFIKDQALQHYKIEGKGRLTEGQFMALCYVHAANIFFKRYGLEHSVSFEHGPYHDPDDDRLS